MDIDWILVESVRVRRDGNNYLVTSMDNTRQACLTFNENQELFFSGVYIETEDYMGFVGLTDTVDDSPADDVIFWDDDTVTLL